MTATRQQMQIQQYVVEIRHAAESVIRLVREDEEALEEAIKQRAALVQEVRAEHHDLAWLNADPDLDDEGLGTLRRWESYFGPEKALKGLELAVKDFELRIATRRFSIAALSGALLQYGKQGISLAHGGNPSPALGRTIGTTQQLSNVVWQSRNQALHWEDASFTGSVVKCFDALAAEVDLAFADYRSRNLATKVVEVLGWTELANMETDLLSLA